MPAGPHRRTLVLTLADLALSPRMQRHALALAATAPDMAVELVGYQGDPVQAPVTAESLRVRCRRLATPPETMNASAHWQPMRSVRAAARGLQLAQVACAGPRPELVLIQSPAPGVARTVSWLAARTSGARLVIDWHNRAQPAGAGVDRPHAVRATMRREGRWARRAHGHLASSRALASWLQREYGVDATVFHDRPPAWCVRPDPVTAATLWQTLSRELMLGPRRIPVAVCPTGWTPTDDFDLLLDALERAERALRACAAPDHGADPALAVILTGRGALKPALEARLARRAFSRLAVRTTWLEAKDYAALLGMADIGICLHQSAFGLDLPGMLAECRGVSLPVYVSDYAPVLNEVLETGKQGVTFRDPRDLAAALVGLAANDLAALPALVSSRTWLASHPAERWDEHWQQVARPVLVP